MHRHGVCVLTLEQLSQAAHIHSIFYNKASPETDYSAAQ
jgi:hypothetical protein